MWVKTIRGKAPARGLTQTRASKSPHVGNKARDRQPTRAGRHTWRPRAESGEAPPACRGHGRPAPPPDFPAQQSRPSPLPPPVSPLREGNPSGATPEPWALAPLPDLPARQVEAFDAPSIWTAPLSRGIRQGARKQSRPPAHPNIPVAHSARCPRPGQKCSRMGPGAHTCRLSGASGAKSPAAIHGQAIHGRVRSLLAIHGQLVGDSSAIHGQAPQTPRPYTAVNWPCVLGPPAIHG